VLAIEESGDAESVVADATDGAPWQEVVVIVCHALPPVMLIAAWTLLVGECLGCVEKETNLRRRYCVNASRPTRLDIIAAIGLAVGGAFGLTGTFVAQLQFARYFRAIDAVGFLVAIALLTLKYFRKGDDCLAAGFLVSARS